jgi:hypothetical protein
MFFCFLKGFANDGQVQTSANGGGDVFQGYALFGNCVVSVSSGSFLQGKPVKAGGVKQVHGRPAVASVPDICRHGLLAGHCYQVRDEPLLDCVVNLRQAHH